MSVSTSESSGRGGHKVRTLHLMRRHGAGGGTRGRPGFGFSVRGGREHGTGFFVSHVEAGSEAHAQGLQVGDRIIRINGFPVEDAVHHEVLQLVQAQNRLSLKVRTVGMLPVKEKANDALSWCIIENQGSPPNQTVSKTGVPTSNKDMPRDVRLSLNVAPHTKLGCGICKGPEWRPGIFVQFTKENGLAREAGLRPGDQIVECNGVPFADISFSEAVNHLKSSRQLDLLVSQGAGLELFPGESSGYNSSASSANGDQSPSWEDTKRLSIVKEESAELEDRLGHLDSLDKHKQWDRIEYEWESKPRGPGNSCTVIRVGENGHIEDCTNETNGTSERAAPPKPPPLAPSSKLAEICMFSQQQETTMVVVEVHRAEEETAGNRPPPPEGPPQLWKSSSSSSCSSLSSAISQELQRRSQRRESEGGTQEENHRKVPLKTIDDEKRHQHEQLMEEFKKAHRRMFASSESGDQGAEEVTDNQSSGEEREAFRSKQRQQPEQQTLQAVKERVQRMDTAGTDRTHRVTSSIHPPPPPPPPSDNLDNLSWSSKPSTIEKTSSASSLSSGKSSPYGVPPACPTPDYDTSSIASSVSSSSSPVRLNGRAGGPSTTTVIVNKTPKFRSTTKVPISVSNASQMSNKGADRVEMDSLESFELNNPSAPAPKPPPTYFAPSVNGRTTPSPQNTISVERSNTTARKPRPVSVTIGEYPTGMDRKAPTRFEFLSASAAVENGHGQDTADAPVTCRLHSELAQTLSRSNLRKRTEAQENLLNGSSTGTSAKGKVTVSVNSEPAISKMPKSQYTNIYSCSHQSNNRVNLFSSDSNNILPTAKPAIRNAAEKLGSTLGNNNRVTIRVHNADTGSTRPGDTNVHLNGILKNASGFSPQHKTVVHQKSITFGEITTVISEIPTQET